jgi:glutamate-1-semialdehyde 2,1-aminomutase
MEKQMEASRKSALVDVMEHNRAYIPGGVSSTNRVIEPAIAFTKGEGAYIWDIQGNRYIDYHAAFGPYFLGHSFEPVNKAVTDILRKGESLFGAGPSVLEGELAELLCRNVEAVEKVSVLNTGSEATSAAIRLSRAVTGKHHFIVMQGGYNGNHDELACNVANSLQEIGPRVCPGEYPLRPIGAGTTIEQTHFVHAVNFNDLESVRYVCRRYPVAAVITEPVLQNIGVVRPQAGYLEGLRRLADELGFLLIFDEVKTGFRHALGGYSAISSVRPDLVLYGKAVANGFPLALIGGKSRYMDYIAHDDPTKRPFVAGTYNGHPVCVAAAVRTIQYLIENKDTIYKNVDVLGQAIEEGIVNIFRKHGIPAVVSRQGSAFSFYLMPSIPRDYHDILENHDAAKDVALRRALINRGVFFVPIATKQCSLSCSHSADDVDFTLGQFDSAVSEIWPRRKLRA